MDGTIEPSPLSERLTMKKAEILSYREGFEDSLELCLEEVGKSKGKQDAIQRIRYLLGLVKERKFDRIKEMLGALK